MGLNSIVKGIVSQMEKVDTVNTHALEKWRKRAVSIAKDLSQSDDKSQYVMSLSMKLPVIDYSIDSVHSKLRSRIWPNRSLVLPPMKPIV
jgi:hypothetical protein